MNTIPCVAPLQFDPMFYCFVDNCIQGEFSWAVAFEKLLWVVSCGKAAVRKQLWEKQKTVWLEVLPNCRLFEKYL
jgi:hypothetical protein